MTRGSQTVRGDSGLAYVMASKQGGPRVKWIPSSHGRPPRWFTAARWGFASIDDAVRWATRRMDLFDKWDDDYPQSEYSGVYVIEGAGLFKIGRGQDPRKRLSGCQSGSPVPLTLVCSFWVPEEMEERLHRRFDRVRVRGEWFRLSGEMVSLIRRALSAIHHRELHPREPIDDAPRERHP